MNKLIKTDGLCKAYKRKGKPPVTVFNNFNFELGQNCKKLCLLGPDGAGKSTFLKLLSGILKPDKGTVLLTGRKPDNNNQEFNQSIGYMSQNLGLYGELSVQDNLKIFSGLKGLDVKKEQNYLQELLIKVNLGKFSQRKADALSGGMKQKLSLTCTLAARPQILLLDEPTVGVDPLSRIELWNVISEYQKQSNCRVIFSTAYLDEAASADYVMILDEGKILIEGSPDILVNELENETYSLNIDQLDYLRGVREVMQICKRTDPFSPLIDVCPRMNRVDLLVEKNLERKSIEEFLNKKIKYPISLSKRSPLLEDLYIYKTFQTGTTSSTNKLNNQIRKENLNKIEAEKTLSEEEVSAKNLKQSEVVVDVENIQKKFNEFTAVRKSSFKVHKGEIFGLLGPNGAGKTTTFRMICALLKPTSGSILINGFNLASAKSDARSGIGYVSQKFSLYRKLTVRQNLEYFGLSYGLHGQELKQRIGDLLVEFNLKKYADIQSEDLPFGVQRQLSMSCALIHKPKILFLDEATSGADPLARRIFFDRVNQLAAQGTCVIITTHFMDEAEYCDNFLIQDQGKILTLGSANEICKKNGERVSIEEAFIDQVTKFRAEESL